MLYFCLYSTAVALLAHPLRLPLAYHPHKEECGNLRDSNPKYWQYPWPALSDENIGTWRR